MRLLESLSQLDWIVRGVAERDADTNPTVAHCIPGVFPSYVKLFHPMYEDTTIRDKEVTWQEQEQARYRDWIPVTEWQKAGADFLSRSTLVYGAADSDARLLPLRWAELARRCGMRFVPTLSGFSFTRLFPGMSWPRYLIGPAEGSLSAPVRDALMSVLRDETGCDRVYFHLWILSTTTWDGDKMYEGSLDEVSRFPGEASGAALTPTHWFPEDRSWLVHTDYDSTFSLIGGSERLIGCLLSHSTLECVRVSPETRVDWRADMENSPL